MTKLLDADIVKFDDFTYIRRDTIIAVKKFEGKVWVNTEHKAWEIQCTLASAVRKWQGLIEPVPDKEEKKT